MNLFNSDQSVEQLIGSIDTSKVAGLRDQLAIRLHIYGCVRFSAMSEITTSSLVYQDGGKTICGLQLSPEQMMPVDSVTASLLQKYVKKAGIAREPDLPLVRKIDKDTVLPEGLQAKSIDSVYRRRVKASDVNRAALKDVQLRLIRQCTTNGKSLSEIATALGRQPRDLYTWLTDVSDVAGQNWHDVPLQLLEKDGGLPSLLSGESPAVEPTASFIRSQSERSRINYSRALKLFSRWCDQRHVCLEQIDLRLIDLFKIDVKQAHTKHELYCISSVVRTWITHLVREEVLKVDAPKLPQNIEERLKITKWVDEEVDNRLLRTLDDQPRVVQLLLKEPPACLQRMGHVWLEEFARFLKERFPHFARRRTVAHNLKPFFSWCDKEGFVLNEITFKHVKDFERDSLQGFKEGYVRTLIAACRLLFDWLVVRGLLNATPVPSANWSEYKTVCSVTGGEIKLLTEEQVEVLLGSCDENSVAGVRDKAALSLMLFAFQTASTACKLHVRDYLERKNRRWLNCYAVQGSSRYEIPIHPELEATLSSYLEMTKIGSDLSSPLLLSVQGRNVRRARSNGVRPSAISAMLTNRRKELSLPEWVNPGTLRLSGMFAYLLGGGSVDKACLLFGVDRIHRGLLASVGIKLDGTELEDMLRDGSSDVSAPLRSFVEKEGIFSLDPSLYSEN